MKIFYIALFLLFTSISYSQSPCPGIDSLNYGNQWYHTVQIGSQCWFKENLNVGKMVPAVSDQPNDSLIEKFCYNNDPSMCNIYGGLYQWREAMQYTMKSGVRGICPSGWHIPLFADYDTLISLVGYDANALKKIGQGDGTNTSGFSAMLSGDNEFTLFYDLANNANLWSSNSHFDSKMGFLEGNSKTLWYDSGINSYIADASYGFSVRCLKDSDGLFLQSPDGGESWQVGSVHKISWDGSNLYNTKIELEYTTDNGINWLQIINSTPAIDTYYNWSIPNTPSKNCKVRITDLNNPNFNDIIDTVFTIYTSCPGGSTIEYGGQIYQTLVIGNHCWLKENLNIGTMIPGSQMLSTNGIIEKYCYNDDTANCSIYGGLYTYGGGPCPVFWHQGIIAEEGYNVLYDGNSLKAIGQGTGFGEGTNASGFSLLLAGVRRSDGTYQNLGKGAYFPYGLIHAGVGYATIINDNSSDIIDDDYFTTNSAGSIRCVMDDIGPLTLKSPVGGENWLIGSTQKINWSLSNVINIKIDYSTDNGTNWINIISSTPTSAGSYNWTIPNTPSTNCKVKISSVNDPDTSSICANVFRIYKVATAPCPGIPTIDYGGQTYNTIAIGDQCWLKENLNIGAMINVTIDPSDNGIIEKHCYNNDTVNCIKYGGLYEWNEAIQYTYAEKTKGVCPTGWHLPTRNELQTLSTDVDSNAFDLLEIGQGLGTNTSGFSALLVGISYSGTFRGFGNYAIFWSSSIYDISEAYEYEIYNEIFEDPAFKEAGESIRCINDSLVSALPVELTSFTSATIDNCVRLNWSTATEINFSSFEVEKKKSNNNTWLKIASIKASGNSTALKQYSYTDKKVNSGKYSYRLKIVDLDGSSKYSNLVNIEVAPPAKFELSNAYPNPWNPTTTIPYQVPINILVTIKVFDALGKEVTTLVNEFKPAGHYEIIFNGKNLSSGIYYYQMKAGNFIETKKIIMIK